MTMEQVAPTDIADDMLSDAEINGLLNKVRSDLGSVTLSRPSPIAYEEDTPEKKTRPWKPRNGIRDLVLADLMRLEDGACFGSDPALFYPADDKGKEIDEGPEVDAAIEFCLNCKRQEDCLEIALRDRRETGIWGATTSRDRRRIRRQNRRRA